MSLTASSQRIVCISLMRVCEMHHVSSTCSAAGPLSGRCALVVGAQSEAVASALLHAGADVLVRVQPVHEPVLGISGIKAAAAEHVATGVSGSTNVVAIASDKEHTVTAACEDLTAAILKDIMDSSAANSSTSSDATASIGYCVTEQGAVQRIDATAMAAMLQSGSKVVDTFVLLVHNGSSSCNGSSGTTNLNATHQDDWTLL
eukprot:5386-Heterococcus_DN1.PRE.2